MNVVLVRGVVTRDPDLRTVAGGTTSASFDLTVQPVEGRASSVPVVLTLDGRPRHDAPHAGDEVVVLGEVRRRFFRAGGGTQSRTEVVASDVVAANDRRRVRRLLTRAAERMGE
jgi:single-strand DNA-binding protein